MSIASPPVTPPSPVLPARSRESRWSGLVRILVLVVVLAILVAVGVVVHRVRDTVLTGSGTFYAGNTPLVDLPYGGGERFVVDDSVGTVHPIVFSVVNSGRETMTLQDGDGFLGQDVAGFRVSRVGSQGPGADIGTAARTALAGVRIRPGQEVELAMYVKGQGCVSSAVGASTTISTVPVTVKVLGFQRVEWVALPELVTVMNPTAGAPSEPRSCLRSAG